MNAWIVVLSGRQGRFASGSCHEGNNALEKYLARMSSSRRELLKKRLQFYLKSDAQPWVRRIDLFEKNGVPFSKKSIWS